MYLLFVAVRQFTTNSGAAQARARDPVLQSQWSPPVHVTWHIIRAPLPAHRLQTHSRGRGLQECTPGSRILGNLLKFCLPWVKSNIRRRNRLRHFHSYPALKKSHATPSRAPQRRGTALTVLLGAVAGWLASLCHSTGFLHLCRSIWHLTSGSKIPLPWNKLHL